MDTILILIDALALINASASFSKKQYDINPIALSKTKIACNFGLSECNRVNIHEFLFTSLDDVVLAF